MIDLRQKTAVVTGVTDNMGFAWAIAKALAAANAEVVLSSHPRVVPIVRRFLQGETHAQSRALPNGQGELAPVSLIGCDVAYDTKEDIPPDVLQQKGYRDCADPSVAGLAQQMQQEGRSVDILIHAVAFSPEIQKSHLQVSRSAYLTAMTVSSYSLVSLCRTLLPLMQDRQAAVVGLSYLAAQRAIPSYGGGMASAKSALECDARMLSWEMGQQGHRVNLISAGPYLSRAARAIGSMQQWIEAVADRSPLRRPINAQEVANATLFLCSSLASGVTGEVLHVDAGFHAMGS
ncbi:MAG: SDR family oxidoreductase [Myxococcota bacterium]